MARTQRQTSIAGTQTEEEKIIESLSDKDRKAIDDDLDYWLSRQSNQRAAGAETKAAHSTLVKRASDHKLTRWPYIDPNTGKKKHLVIKREPKATTMNAPRRAPRPETPGAEVEPKSKAEKKADADANKVEHRKVKSKDAKAELRAIKDAVSAKDNADSPMAQGAAAVDGALRPGRSYDDENDPFASTRSAMADVDHEEATEH